LDQILVSKLETKPDNWNSIQIGFIGTPMAELAKRQEPPKSFSKSSFA
jgi:hypothetical protein